jgi:hypothetical protein
VHKILNLQYCNLIWNVLHDYDFTAKYLINFLASYCGVSCCLIPPIAVLFNSLWTTVTALKQVYVYMLTKFMSSITSHWRWTVCKTYNIHFVLADCLKRLKNLLQCRQYIFNDFTVLFLNTYFHYVCQLLAILYKVKKKKECHMWKPYPSIC